MNDMRSTISRKMELLSSVQRILLEVDKDPDLGQLTCLDAMERLTKEVLEYAKKELDK